MKTDSRVCAWALVSGCFCWASWVPLVGAVDNGDFEAGFLAPWVLKGAGAAVSNIFSPPIAPPGGTFMGYITTLNNEGIEDFGFFNERPDLDENGVKESEYSALSLTFTTAAPAYLSVNVNFLTDELNRESTPDAGDADVFGLATGDIRSGPYRFLFAIAPSDGSYAGRAMPLTPASFSHEVIRDDRSNGSQFKGQTGFTNFCFLVDPGPHTWTFFVADSKTDGVASAMLIDDFRIDPVIRPQLAISRSGSNVVLSWPTNAMGFALQAASQLASDTSWNEITSELVIVEDRFVTTNALTSGHTVYRLRKLR